MILRCIDQHLYELRCGMFSAVHLPKSHFRGRRHRFLSGLGALRSTYKGRSTSCPVGFHRTQETLRLCGCSGLLSKFLEELCLVYLSLSPFQDEINKVNVNNSLSFHYTMVYRLFIPTNQQTVTSSTKQQSCQSVSS